ncbi:MAG TPA: hypothetical protein DEB37_16735 [Lysinibacillus sp.]|uniref:hypothetical protein n=1 Tax=Lysinibacillus TaxID=400634 RepID=UPI000569F517|nr:MULTISPECIES: hypothetical protein [Lysinibacillus]KUF37366.1 hypothetical protein AK833_00310 [Lysinibacillus sp. F5]HBT73823.1 hypothetical protein [Lysinibacillus sp.]
MIEIIYDTNSLEGSCYIEILPDQYRGECWNSSSIYFTEDNFGYILPAIDKHYKKFDYFAFNEIEMDIWDLINQELERMKQFLNSKPNPNSLKEGIGFLYGYSEQEFIENYDTNVQQLITMITEFQSWIMQKRSTTQFISVLGI